jgi:multiple sugar transport system substrate-binding protein
MGKDALSRRGFIKLGGGALGALVFGSSLAACGQGSAGGSNPAASSGRKVINFVTAKFESTTSMQDFVKPFNDSSSSYQVVVRELPPPSQSTEVHQQLVQQLGAGSGDIDVFTQDVIWPAEFASAGWAMDLSSEFPQAERDKFFPGLVQSVTWQDKLVGLPFYLDAGQLYYRKDVLKDKGMKVPTTWQELATSAKALQGSGDIKNGFLWQGKQAEVLVCNVVSFVGGAGGAILGPDGKTVMIADQPAQTAIQFMYDTMNSLNITPKDVLSWDEEPSRKPFTAGNAAFLRQWSYVWKVSQDASQSQVVGKVGVAPLPHFPGGKSAACLGGYQLGVSESSKNKDGAVEFLRWMTSLDTQIRYAELFGSNPALRSAYADPRLAKVSPAMVQLKDVFEGGTPRPITPKYPQVSLAIQSAVSKALTTGDVAGNLAKVKSEIEKIVST